MRVKRQSYGNKLFGSIIGAILGIIIFLGSFIVLYINEGREDLSKITKEAEVITNAEHNLKDGSLVFVKGSLNAQTYTIDDFLTNDNLIFISRKVEMFAFVEKEHKESKDNLGGSTTTTITYSYEERWTSTPQKSTTFQGDEDELPSNIDPDYDNWIDQKPPELKKTASNLSIGDFSIEGDFALSGEKTLSLNQTNTQIQGLDNSLTQNNYIYYSSAHTPDPASSFIGDFRISYSVITSSDMGIFLGAVDGDTISAFSTKKDNELFRFFAGVDSKDKAVSILQTEHKVTTWVLRFVGWFMMFFGLLAMTKPVTKFLSVIPFFSRISGLVFGVAAFFISLVLTALTILLSIVLNNFWLAVAFIILLIIIIALVITSKRKKALSRRR